LELIIVDDHSSDDTIEKVKMFNDQRIFLKRNKENCGAAASRNRALHMAKGKWIAFLDSDDLWMPDKLEKQIQFMYNNGYAFSYTCYEEIDEIGNALGVKVSGPKKITKKGMYDYCWLGCLTVMYDKEVIRDLKIKDIKKNNDYAMWLKVIKKADCYLLEENLAKYRNRSGSISNHGYLQLVKWHYRLFRNADGHNPVTSILLTTRNLFFGCWKKFKYVKS